MTTTPTISPADDDPDDDILFDDPDCPAWADEVWEPAACLSLASLELHVGFRLTSADESRFEVEGGWTNG